MILVVILYILFVCAFIYFFNRNRPEYYQTPFGYTPVSDRTDLPADVEAFIVRDDREVYDSTGSKVERGSKVVI